ncbi:MAG: MATE family efflux transporter, partial [Candidatus Nomurabacteria bacterium]|nr:MATE family efflux transporter [Candidatus Nomurabacteria bacterium]
MSRKIFNKGSVLRAIFAISLPVVGAQLLQAAYQMTDAFWVGRLGAESVAAISVSMPIMFILIAFGIGFAASGTTLVAQYFGAKNRKMVNHTSAQTLTSIVVVSLIVTIVGIAISPLILDFMSVTPNVYGSAVSYMQIAFLGVVFNFSFMMFQSLMRGIGQVVMPMLIVAATVLLNFVLDPLFIFTFNMGITGAALATIGTQSLAAIVGFAILFGGKFGIHLSLRDFSPDKKHIAKSFRLGLPISLAQVTNSLAMLIITGMVTVFGTIATAAVSAGMNVINLFFMVGLGFSFGVQALVGQNIGARNIPRARQIVKTGSAIIFGFMCLLGVVVFAFSTQLVGIFVPNEPEVIEIGATFLKIVALFFGFGGLQMALLGVLRAAGKMMVVMLISIISQFVVQIPLAWQLSARIGIDGIWWSFVASFVVSLILTWGFYLQGGWARK